jgi:hypothetical protein
MENIQSKNNQKNEIYLRVKLAEHLDCDIEEIEQGYDDSTFEHGNAEYLLLTDSEADERAKDYIKETVWAFNSWYIAKHTGLNEKIIKHLQNECEEANDIILNSIKDIDKFISDAISEDGRGHFMSSYDGEEVELADNLFLYRIN